MTEGTLGSRLSVRLIDEPKFRLGEEKENGRQGCLVCVAGPEVRGQRGCFFSFFFFGR